MGINFKNPRSKQYDGAWVDVDDTGENENADESAEFLAFGDYLYHRVWVKPTAKATTTVSSSNVVTLTLSNVTEDVTTKTITGTDPFEIDETSKRIRIRRTDKNRDGSVYGNCRYGNVYERRDGNDGGSWNRTKYRF